MMPENTYLRLLEGNRKFVEDKLSNDPTFFDKLAHTQKPEFLWIGCADSRVPADQITGTNPGEIFVCRNIANLVVHTDMALLSVLDYAVNALKVKHIVVCGHYGCGGVKAAMGRIEHGILDNWVRNIKDVYRLHHVELDAITDEDSRWRRLVELNVMEQAYNVCKTSIVQNAWESGDLPHVHGWVYDVANGKIKELSVDYKSSTQFKNIYQFDA
jgi:carbonic anhydrase